MSAQLAMDFSASPSPAKPHRAVPRASSWKAYAEYVARYRTCVRLDLGRTWACEWPWEPGDLAVTERIGPERRPCPLCELRRELSAVIARGLHAEMDAEASRVAALSYREWLGSDAALMRKVQRAESGTLGALERADDLVTALVMLREHGSVEAALEELSDDAYAMDSDFYSVVRLELRLMSVPMRDVWRCREEAVR